MEFRELEEAILPEEKLSIFSADPMTSSRMRPPVATSGLMVFQTIYDRTLLQFKMEL